MKLLTKCGHVGMAGLGLTVILGLAWLGVVVWSFTLNAGYVFNVSAGQVWSVLMVGIPGALAASYLLGRLTVEVIYKAGRKKKPRN